MEFICREVFICCWRVLYARVVLMDMHCLRIPSQLWLWFDGIMVWNEETMSNERVHIEMLMLDVRTLQHTLASAAAAVGSNELLSAYFCSKAIDRKIKHLQYVVSFLVYHTFSLNWRFVLHVECTCFASNPKVNTLKNLRALNFGSYICLWQFFCKYHRNWKHSFEECVKLAIRVC